MPNFRILYSQTSYYHAWVEAESESAARQAFIDGDVDDSTFLDGEGTEIIEIDCEDE